MDLTIGAARRMLGDLIRMCALTADAAESLPLETAMEKLDATNASDKNQIEATKRAVADFLLNRIPAPLRPIPVFQLAQELQSRGYSEDDVKTAVASLEKERLLWRFPNDTVDIVDALRDWLDKHPNSIEQPGPRIPLPPHSQPAEAPAPNDNDCKPKASPKPRWRDWAIGLEHGKRWHLFKRHAGEWYQHKLVEGISMGRQQRLMTAFADGGGSLTKSQALKLELEHYSAGDVDRLMGVIKPEISRLRGIIRVAIGVNDDRADPLPFDETNTVWRAEIQIGYATQEDREYLGGEHRLRFKIREQLTVEDRAD
jgi:hypothetical protein